MTVDFNKMWNSIRRPSVWLPVLLLLLLIGGVVWWWLAREKRYKYEIIKRDVLIIALNNKWMECVNAPADTFFVHTVIVLPSSEVITPKPIKVIDTVYIDSTKYKIAYYNDTLVTDKYKVNYEALGWLKWYRVLGIELDHDYMIVKKNHVIVQHDTAWLPAKVKRWHWGLEGQVFVNDFKSMPGLGGGVFVIFQEKLQLGVGPAYFNDFGGYLRLGYIIK